MRAPALAALVTLASVLVHFVAVPRARAQPFPVKELLAVGWVDPTSGRGVVRAMRTRPPFEVVTPALETDPQPFLRFARGPRD